MTFTQETRVTCDVSPSGARCPKGFVATSAVSKAVMHTWLRVNGWHISRRRYVCPDCWASGQR